MAVFASVEESLRSVVLLNVVCLLSCYWAGNLADHYVISNELRFLWQLIWLSKKRRQDARAERASALPPRLRALRALRAEFAPREIN
jgi:hypothetical protein